MSKKRVYLFEEADGKNRLLFGGKGAGLADMTKAGLPVPPGFIITTEVCKEYYENGKKLPEGLMEEVLEAMKKLEEKTGKKFADPENPLLVSVRSGAPVSMPGMMDTILNLGLNDETVEGLAKRSNNERFAYDSYRRFIQMFGNVVLGIPHEKFEEILDHYKKEQGVKLDSELSADTLKKVVEAYKELVKKETGKDFPQNPYEQLEMAIRAVFDSWNNERAIIYRKLHNIPEDYGTAVNIVTMVFGNMGNDSGTGVAFTRNPSTGEKEFYGEYLTNAQGEDVVAGIRTPQPISKLAEEMPEVYKQLLEVRDLLEKYYRDVQDIEFTIEKGKLYMLQTRNAKRTARAAVKIAVDMVKEGLITKEEAILRVSPDQINQLLHAQIDPNAPKKVIAKGLPASPGAASGKVVFSSREAEKRGKEGEKVILVRPETTPDDIGGLAAAQGVLTSRGGMTSHAAVVARGMGKPAVVGCEAIKIDLNKEEFTVGDVVIKKDDIITIDGSTGEVILGEVPMIPPTLSEELKELLSWADEIRKIGVRANADTPEDAQKAFEYGAEGIGLARTEHMFLGNRLPLVQEMILAETEEDRRKALDKLLPVQREDFIGLFKAMQGKPVTIRLIDPPLHEFLPPLLDLTVEVELMKAKGITGKELEEKERLLSVVRRLHEFNPMLGFRGCRLGMVYPEIFEMQVRAIMEAAVAVAKEGLPVKPEIMIPLVALESEMKVLGDLIHRVAKQVIEESGVNIEYKVGTMIEVPRAALIADKLAGVAQFFSFGTNDLTQMTFAFSRDDAEGKFLGRYREKGYVEEDPFEHLDTEGVGELMKIAVQKGRSTRPDLKVGICGEHGGDPKSIEFCYIIGLDYVSCSPFRVPVARLAAAQATLKHQKKMEFVDRTA
ncbi:MAG: pyruvate, phosphate dikinase [Dictyoglomus sp.]|jgi:pyruvate,orthophosphate dikinase|uniref:Pyruvate, phosphate dikinase n=1 Tax=Dictyoglomus turgidum (strain DSM 6724 / Z-1310) TaxID=515635 RepID=B8E0E7_DICTD|nr:MULTISPECIES: pyruvate, phosphate dikinase [Dictyoglomus]ACK42592.1 pyruvate, phosphate dikinase [Dictyoglomus turgidum DSM 6724]HBU31181.1 pyruvate, phosphate dikinase [Dictyoglomus sp.]